MSGRGGNAPKQQRAVETRKALLEGAAQVFSRMTYAEARLKDISRASGVSEGAMYFHFGNKGEIAAAVLEEQQERMTGVLTKILTRPDDSLRKLAQLVHEMAALISSDVVVQGGIKLSTQPLSELEKAAHEPYFEWIRIVRTLIKQGVEDGSIIASIDVESSAEFVNALFVGTQILSELADSWASLPKRIKALEPYLLDVFCVAEDVR